MADRKRDQPEKTGPETTVPEGEEPEDAVEDLASEASALPLPEVLGPDDADSAEESSVPVVHEAGEHGGRRQDDEEAVAQPVSHGSLLPVLSLPSLLASR